MEEELSSYLLATNVSRSSSCSKLRPNELRIPTGWDAVRRSGQRRSDPVRFRKDWARSFGRRLDRGPLVGVPGKISAHSLGEKYNVCLQVMQGRIQILGHAV